MFIVSGFFCYCNTKVNEVKLTKCGSLYIICVRMNACFCCRVNTLITVGV